MLHSIFSFFASSGFRWSARSLLHTRPVCIYIRMFVCTFSGGLREGGGVGAKPQDDRFTVLCTIDNSSMHVFVPASLAFQLFFMTLFSRFLSSFYPENL